MCSSQECPCIETAGIPRYDDVRRKDNRIYTARPEPVAKLHMKTTINQFSTSADTSLIIPTCHTTHLWYLEIKPNRHHHHPNRSYRSTNRSLESITSHNLLVFLHLSKSVNYTPRCQQQQNKSLLFPAPPPNCRRVFSRSPSPICVSVFISIVGIRRRRCRHHLHPLAPKRGPHYNPRTQYPRRSERLPQ